MKMKILLEFLLGLLIFGNTYATETEPNNTPAQANVLPLNGSNSGIINPAGDVDFYKVTTNADGQLNITLTPLSGKYMWIYLYDNDGVTLLTSNNANGTFTVSQDGLAAGTYYIEVNCYYNTDTSSYTISNTLTPASVANDTEPDSTIAQANTLPVNSTTTGHIDYYYNNHRDSVDWYKITTSADGLLQLKLTSNNGQYVWAYLFDNDGKTVLNSNNFNATGYINTDGLAAGTYYVRINTYYNTGFAPYTLTDSLFSPTQANDAEPDSTVALALNLPVNDSTTGHINYYYNNHRDSADWYKITTAADGLLQLKLTSNNGQYVWAYLYDHDGMTVLNSNNFNGTGYINTDGLAAGTYYVRINTYYNTGFAPYTLTDSLFSPAQANDKEPDSTVALALNLPVNSTTTGHIDYYYNNHRDSVDWYKITTTADGLLQLKLTSNNGQYVWAYLYDHDGTTLLNSNDFNGTGYINTDGLASGTYYVRINTYYNNGFAPYTLTDSLFTYNKVDSEPNGYFNQAQTIPANRTITGHVDFYYNDVRDTVDTWKVNYTGTNGNLNLTLNLLPHNIDGSLNYTWFQVYKDTSAAPIFSNNFNTSSTAINLTGLSQGYYYIKVFEYYNTNFEAYSITDSFIQVNTATITLAKAYSSSTACGSDSLTYNLGASSAPYTVRLYKDGGIIDSLITNSATASFTGLNDGNYYATVYGDGATDSAYSKTGSTQFLPPTLTGLTTTNVGAHAATLNFAALSCVQNYTIEYKITGTSTYTTLNTNANGTYTLSGLNSNTTYTWRIESIDATNGLTGNFSDTANFTTLSALPVTFLNFDGVLIDSKAQLTWSTATELNNKGFEVQKSTDGQNFTAIGFVKGNGNSYVINTYNFIDVKVLSGHNYYRLKQEDIDDNFNYSSTIRLDFKRFDWAVFGNPVTPNSWIQLQLANTSHVAIQVMTIDGNIIKTIDKGTINEGTYSIPLNLSNVASGVYIVRLITDNQSFSKEIIK